MKKYVSLFLVFSLLFCLIGCGGDAETTETTAPTGNGTTVSYTPQIASGTNYGTLKSTDGSDTGITIDWTLFEYFARNSLHDLLDSGYNAESLKADLGSVIQDDMTGAEIIKSNCLEYIKNYYALFILADQHNIALTDAEKKTLAEAKTAAIESEGGKAGFLSALSANYLTETNYDFLQEHSALYNKLLTALFGEGGVHAVAKEDVIASTSENYLRVVHILIQADANSADFAEKTAYANEVLARVDAGEDFMTLVSELSEDPGSTSQPDGYIFDKNGYTMDGGQMMQEFVDGSWALEVGQHSGLVQTSYGYHIIKRLPLDEEYITANYEQFHSFAAESAFSSELYELVATLTIETNDAFAALDMAAFIPDVPSTTTADSTVTPAQ